MSAQAVVNDLNIQAPWTGAEKRYGNQVELRSDGERLPAVLTILKHLGFEHLVNITCVDLITDGILEAVYNLWSYRRKVHATVKVPTKRNEPRLPTVCDFWPQAQVYEREVHEFFGLIFDGNPDLGPFFLHNWKDLPPLRKDFDTREYSRRAYGFLEDEA